MEIMKYDSKQRNLSTAVTSASLPYVKGLAGQKNYYSNDYLSVTPMMQEIFADGKELQPPDVFERPELLNFNKINIGEAPKRKLTNEEYSALPSFCKNRFLSFLHGIAKGIIPLALMIFGIFISIFMIIQTHEVQPFSVLFGLIFFIVGFILGIPYLKSSVVKPDSLVTIGNIIFFTEEATGSFYGAPVVNRIGVGFYDEKTYIKDFCQVIHPEKTERDMKVLYLNGKLYYLKDGKFYSDQL